MFKRPYNIMNLVILMSILMAFLSVSGEVWASSDFEVDFSLSSGFSYSLTVKDGAGNITEQFNGDFGLGEADTVTYIDTGIMFLDGAIGVWVEALDGSYNSLYSSDVYLSTVQAGISGSWAVTDIVSSVSVSGDEFMTQTATEHEVPAEDDDPVPPAASEEGEENAVVTYPRPEPGQSRVDYIITLTPEQAAHYREVIRNRRALYNGEDPETDQLTFNYSDSINSVTQGEAVPELPMGAMQMMVLALGGVLARFRKRF